MTIIQKGELMDDLISRQAAIDAVCMEWCGVKHQDCKHPFDAEKDDYYWCDGCETALRTLPDLPSAQPEPMCVAKVTLTDEQIKEAFEKAKCEILAVQSAQPEIIRCKDCKYSSDDEYCHCSKVTWWTGENDFCSRAERRTDEPDR